MTPGPSMTPPPSGFPASSPGAIRSEGPSASAVAALSASQQRVLTQLRSAAAMYASDRSEPASSSSRIAEQPIHTDQALSPSIASSSRQRLSSDELAGMRVPPDSLRPGSTATHGRTAPAHTSSKYCAVCDTPMSTPSDLANFAAAPLLARRGSTRDAPAPSTPSTASNQLLCSSCRQELTSASPVQPNPSLTHAPRLEDLMDALPTGHQSNQEERNGLSRETHAPDLASDAQLSTTPHAEPSTEQEHAAATVHSQATHNDATMTLSESHASAAPSSPSPQLGFGPHLMTRPRLSTWTLQPFEPVASQLAEEISCRRGDHNAKSAVYIPSASSRPSAARAPSIREQSRIRMCGSFFDHGRPDPLQDVTYLRRLPSSRGCLHAGARFEGKQTSDKSSYDVTVIFTHVDLEASHLCGTINIRGLTADWPELITFFDAEIIGTKHGFVTGKWGATETEDAKHWGRFAPFKPLRNFLDKPDSRFDHLNKPYVFMRWKERFLVPDHKVKDVTGASYDGFYYVCLALDPEGADPVLPMPKPEVSPSSALRHLPGGMYPSSAGGGGAPRLNTPQLAEAIMNSPTGRIPSTYSPSWNPATSSLASAAMAQAQARRLEASVQSPSVLDAQAVGSGYLGSGPTIASASAAGSASTSSAAAAPSAVAADDIGIAALVHPNWAMENALLQRRRAGGATGRLSATAAGLVPSQPQLSSIPTGRRTYTSQTVPGEGTWVVMTEMEVEAETDSASGSSTSLNAPAPDHGRSPGLAPDATAADAVCDPPLGGPVSAETSAAPTAAAWLGAGAPSRSLHSTTATSTRQSSRGLLDATLSQGSRSRRGASPLASEQVEVQAEPAAARSGRLAEPVVGRCVGYYFSEHSEPFQQISLRYVPERPSGSFELR